MIFKVYAFVVFMCHWMQNITQLERGGTMLQFKIRFQYLLRFCLQIGEHCKDPFFPWFAFGINHKKWLSDFENGKKRTRLVAFISSFIHLYCHKVFFPYFSLFFFFHFCVPIVYCRVYKFYVLLVLAISCVNKLN